MEKKLKKERDDILTKCEISSRYHNARLGFYDFWQKLFLFISISGGFFAFSQQIKFFLTYVLLIIAVAGVATLVFNTQARARKHEILREKFNTLAGEIAANLDYKKNNISNWIIQFHNLYNDQPAPYYKALDVHCHNEVVEALHHEGTKKYAENRYKIKWWQYYLKNIRPFSTTGFEKIKPSLKSIK